MELTRDLSTDTEPKIGPERSPSVASIESGSQNIGKSFDTVVFDVLMVSPEQFAELSSCAWNKKGKHTLAPNVVAFTRRFNQLSFWVVREILTKQMLKTRVDVLSHFIKITKLLSRKDKAMFEKLETLMSKEDNYKELRAYVSCLRNTPCIPYLGMHPSDLTSLDAAYPAAESILEDAHRCEQINNVLRVISDLQQFYVYDLPSLPHIQKYLNSARYIEELQFFLEQDNYRQGQCICRPITNNVLFEDLALHDGPLSSTEVVEYSDGDATTTCLCLMGGHGKWQSADYNGRWVSITDPKRAIFPGSRPQSLLDDSVMEDSLLWVMQTKGQPACDHSQAFQEESSDDGEKSTRPAFESFPQT